VVVGANYAYVIDMINGVRVVNISQPNAPQLTGSLDQVWTFNSGAVLHGNFLYTGNWRMGLGVINVAVPSNPVFVKTYQPGGYTNKVTVLDHYILMACDLFGICVADITDPANPVYQATLFFDAPSEITGIEVRGNTMFVANNYDGLRIFDVTSPVGPVQIAAYPDLSIVSSFEGFAQGLAVEGDYAYLADNHGLRVIQISDRLNPIKVGQVLFSAGPGSTKNLVVSGNYAYLTIDNTLEIYDIQNKAAPWKVSTYTFPHPATFISGLGIRDDLAYIADFTAGLKILNIQDRAHPQEIGSVSAILWAVDVVFKDNLALVCDANRGLVILNVTQPQNPIEIGHYSPFSPTSTVYSTGIAVQDHLVYLKKSDGLVVLDIRNPTQPALTGSSPNMGSTEMYGNQIKFSGDAIYLNGHYAGVYILKQQDLPNVYIPLVAK
jgi:hypothetical protein